MFEHVSLAPPDAILGLTEDFRRDPNPQKINLGVGVYMDELGGTPVLTVVKEAERRILESEASKTYLPIDGRREYGEGVRRLIFGSEHELAETSRVVTAHAPGGTGALRVAFDFLKRIRPSATVWLSEPSWPNHPQICAAAGLDVRTYPYFDRQTNGLAFAAMLDVLETAAAGDVVVLHGCCHNPTGVDPSPEQWSDLGALLARRRVMPLVDFAYQGFASGLTEDAEGIRRLLRAVPELMICNSFSKNFALYNERVGAVTVVADSPQQGRAVQSQLKSLIRANYSNPPGHGSAIVTTILANPDLCRQWEDELRLMRQRVRQMRNLFARELDQRGVQLAVAGNEFIVRQNGMFSFSGLDPEQVQVLRDQHSVYIVGSGRVSVAGMTESNMPRLCDAIATVAKER